MTFDAGKLKQAHTRDELAILWRYLQLCMHLAPNLDWRKDKAAFKQRAAELGIEWKG